MTKSAYGERRRNCKNSLREFLHQLFFIIFPSIAKTKQPRPSPHQERFKPGQTRLKPEAHPKTDERLVNDASSCVRARALCEELHIFGFWTYPAMIATITTRIRESHLSKKIVICHKREHSLSYSGVEKGGEMGE